MRVEEETTEPGAVFLGPLLTSLDALSASVSLSVNLYRITASVWPQGCAWHREHRNVHRGLSRVVWKQPRDPQARSFDVSPSTGGQRGQPPPEQHRRGSSSLQAPSLPSSQPHLWFFGCFFASVSVSQTISSWSWHRESRNASWQEGQWGWPPQTL